MNFFRMDQHLIKSAALLASHFHRRITRCTTREAARVFTFLELPPEIRNMIYGYCFDLSGFQTFFDKHYVEQRAILEANKDKVKTLVEPAKYAPNILLLNKQIYLECKGMLCTENLVFNHGLVMVNSLHHCVSPWILHKIHHITITDEGHPMMTNDILSHSWYGYQRLFEDLTHWLCQGHNLKTFTIKFTDPLFHQHMQHHPFGPRRCHYSRNIRSSMKQLSKIGGIGKVTIEGMREGVAKRTAEKMESCIKGFMGLPRAVRYKIYHYANL